MDKDKKLKQHIGFKANKFGGNPLDRNPTSSQQ